MSRRVLVLTPTRQSSAALLPEAFKTHAPAIWVDFLDATSVLIDKVESAGYDAVVCWADRPDELELVVRIRKINPSLPVVLVSSEHDATFRNLAMERGATAFLPDARSLPVLVGLIEQAVEIRAAARVTRTLAAQGREMSRELRELATRAGALVHETVRRLERPGQPLPLPLLVSNDPNQAFQMVRAFEKADLYAPLPILRSTDEAIAYLSGQPPYQRRDHFPLPSLVLLDLHGPAESGLELLAWIRLQQRLKHLPVIILSAALDPEAIKGAYGLRVNSYLIKPGDLEELADMVKAIKTYWASLNVTPET